MADFSKVVNTRQLIVVFVLLSLPALYAYNPFTLYFLNDDFIHIPLSQHAVWGQRNSIRPFNDLSLYFDTLVWGTNATGYHITNLIIHFFCSLLIYFFALQNLNHLQVAGNLKFWAAAIALFFWSYAFHSESVFWIIGRTGCLSTFFFLICFIMFLSGKRKWFHYFISFFSFFCGLLTYESIWILPPALVMYYVCFKKFRGTPNVVLIMGYWSLFAYYFYLRILWTGEVAGNYEVANIKSLNFFTLVMNYCKLIARSFVAPQLNSVLFILTAIVALALVTFAAVKLVKEKTYSFAWLIFTILSLVSFLPYISLGIDTHGIEAERYLYLPSVFVCILLVALLGSFKNKKAAIFAFLAYFLYNQWYLIKESYAFEKASFVSKNTIRLVGENIDKRYYYFKNLPMENYGIPIFRLGLAEGVFWLTDQRVAADKLRIVSFNTDDNFRYKVTPVVIEQIDEHPMTVDSFSVKNRFTDHYSTINAKTIIQPDDIFFEYSDTSIKVYNRTPFK